jgi:hypothetical protein
VLLLEVLVVVAWALVVTRPYHNLDPQMIPDARPEANEYLAIIPSNYFWDWVKECGTCSFWNGSLNGGIPALADPYTSMLHPVVAVPVLLFGVAAGTKLAIVGAFVMGGVAQWWLAYVVGVGRVARVWSGCMAVAAGHLAGRMELGFYGLVVSTAACTLVLPPLIAFARSGSRRMAVLTGVALGLAAVAGQGYLQIALIATLPAVLIILPWQRAQFWRRVRQGVLAAAIAALLAAPLLVPLFHFLPHYTKYGDPELASGQPFPYVLLNLVINDPAFYETESFGKLPYAYLYVNYIGWIPLLLAFWGVLRTVWGAGARPWPRLTLYLLAIALIPLWLISDVPLPALAEIAPPGLAEQIRGLRFYSSMGSLGVPPILALSALGLDALLRDTARWRLLLTSTRQPGRPLWSLDARWLLSVPLAVAIVSGWSFGSHWIQVRHMRPEVYPVLRELQSPDLQWVVVPRWYHSHFVEPAVGMGFKLTDAYRPFVWKDREDPQPVMKLQYSDIPPEGMSLQAKIDVVHIFAPPAGNEYAVVHHADASRTVCTARGTGGMIDVQCDVRQPGDLVVREHAWTGWQAWVDGRLVPLRRPGPVDGDTWLGVADVPVGEHTIQFRYRPWDVPLGVVLCAGGVVLAGGVWWRSRGYTSDA